MESNHGPRDYERPRRRSREATLGVVFRRKALPGADFAATAVCMAFSVAHSLDPRASTVAFAAKASRLGACRSAPRSLRSQPASLPAGAGSVTVRAGIRTTQGPPLKWRRRSIDALPSVSAGVPMRAPPRPVSACQYHPLAEALRRRLRPHSLRDGGLHAALRFCSESCSVVQQPATTPARLLHVACRQQRRRNARLRGSDRPEPISSYKVPPNVLRWARSNLRWISDSVAIKSSASARSIRQMTRASCAVGFLNIP